MNLSWNTLNPDQIERIVNRALASTPTETLDHAEFGPYLQKWLIQRKADGSARYVHRFLRPDADNEFHDHPWDNRTICYANGYFDEGPAGKRWIAPSDTLVRSATDFHRVTFDLGKLPITIFEHGPKYNAWGFLNPHGEKVSWQEFTATNGAFRR